MAACFEPVKRFADASLPIPKRQTENSAGYDLTVAEDIVIPSYLSLHEKLYDKHHQNHEANIIRDMLRIAYPNPDENDKVTETELQEASYKANCLWENAPITLEEMAGLTKSTAAKPTLVSTGMKCKLDPGTYLEITVRSSTPLKYWLVLANGKGIIDSDYYNNDQNDGEIFLQLINLSPFSIKLQKGDRLGQAIIHSYLTAENDLASGERKGGFGSSG